MNNLTVIKKDGQLVTDSREVAEMVEKRHSDLLRDMEGYIQILENATLRSQDFFIESSYKAEGNNKKYKCYLLTKKGCDMVANKMIGEKGVLFTATYVTKFEEMEKQIKTPQLSEKDKLALDIFHGGVNAIVSHKKLVEMEVDEETKKIRNGNNKIITMGTAVEMLGIAGLTTTLLNKWFCRNGFGRFEKVGNERNRFFVPNEKFKTYVAGEGYSLTGSTTKGDKTRVFFSTEMVTRLLEKHAKSLVDFVKSEKGETIWQVHVK